MEFICLQLLHVCLIWLTFSSTFYRLCTVKKEIAQSEIAEGGGNTKQDDGDNGQFKRNLKERNLKERNQ